MAKLNVDAAAAYYFDRDDNLVAIEGRDFKTASIEIDPLVQGLELFLKGVKGGDPLLFKSGKNLDAVKDLNAISVVYIALLAAGTQLTILGVETLVGVGEGQRMIEGLKADMASGPICCCPLVPGPRGPVCPCPTKKC